MNATHADETSPMQQVVNRLTALIARPGFVATVTVLVFLWIGINLGRSLLGRAAIDPPPFYWLQGAIGILAVHISALILSSQRRAEKLAGQRQQLILELAILNDQKVSKIIELIEFLRRDNPAILDRLDREAQDMAVPSDTFWVLDCIKDAYTQTQTDQGDLPLTLPII
jgi:uncharacterized membrane protein